MSKRPQYQRVHVLQMRPSLFGDGAAIGDIGQVPPPITVYRQAPVEDREDPQRKISGRESSLRRISFDGQNSAPRLNVGIENVGVNHRKTVEDLARGVNRDRPSGVKLDGPEFVQSEEMVHMSVRVNHPLDRRRTRAKELDSEVDGRVEQEITELGLGRRTSA